MPSLKNVIHRLALELEKPADLVARRINRALFPDDTLTIAPYAGYGKERELRVRGRVLRGVQPERPTATDTVFENVSGMAQRFLSREVGGAVVRATYLYPDNEEGVSTEAVSDEEGYFESTLLLPEPAPYDRVWHDVYLTLPGRSDTFICPVFVPPVEASFGIISDIDDTILQTGATRKWEMIRLTLTGNAHTRMAFKGVSAFYRTLHGSHTGTAKNPIFYVSSSPWNIYDFLTDFLQVNGIPKGPIFLRDLGLDESKLFAHDHTVHKREQIDRLLQFYDHLPFLLIGDSGQDDPEIYRDAALAYSSRIWAIYIRDVLPGPRREAVEQIQKEVSALGVDFLLVADTEAAAAHAAVEGYIEASVLPDVQAEKAKDEAAAK